MRVRCLISGGQTGVDRAALDVAMQYGITPGGWCPRGRGAEDGPIDDRYALVETASPNPAHRTVLNVRDADGTLILARGPLRGGTALAARAASRLQRPLLAIDPQAADAAERIRDWLRTHAIETLNVAGPRESEHAGIHQLARDLLERVLAPSDRQPSEP